MALNDDQLDSLHRLGAGGKVKLTISQETFDETVKETMEDFEMDFEEALQEAMEQFKMQGVDLRNIRKDDPATRTNEAQGVQEACASLRECLEEVEKNGISEETKAKTLQALADLRSECEISDERRAFASNQGAMPGCTAINIHMISDKDIVAASLETMASLLKLDLCREACREPSSNSIIAIMDHYRTDAELQLRALATIKQACIKTEFNKATFDERGVNTALVQAIETHPENAQVCKAAVDVVRCLVVRDDTSEMTDQCFARANKLNEERVLHVVCGVYKSFHKDTTIVPTLLSSLAVCGQSKGNVDVMVRQGVTSLALETFAENQDNVGIVKDGCFLLGALVQVDEQKTVIGQGQGLLLIMSAMDKHRANIRVVNKAMKAMASLALRHPDNSQRIAENAGIPLICDLMRAYPDKLEVQQPCINAIRNIVSRHTDLIPMMIDEGAEELIRRASAHPRCNEIAFAALRDLHCDLTFKEEWKGEIGNAFAISQGDGEDRGDEFEALKRQVREEMNEATGLAKLA